MACMLPSVFVLDRNMTWSVVYEFLYSIACYGSVTLACND